MKPPQSTALALAKNLLLPLAVSAYPVLFLYGRNARILSLKDIGLPLGMAMLAAVAGFGLFYLFQRRQATASLSMAVFMAIYYLYGGLYNGLVALDRFPVRHFILLPVVVSLGIYAGYFLSLIRVDIVAVLQKIALWVSLGLVGFNLVLIAPVEIQKAAATAVPAAAPPSNGALAASHLTSGKKLPDIYYIIFDEYVGFQAMRDYWHDNSVDQFAAFLAQNHFFLAPDSHSATINTLSEMASRLNLHQYMETTDPVIMTAALQNNKVMAILKSYGYTTVSINMAIQGIKADRSVTFSPQAVLGMGPDEFLQTFVHGTMADAFGNLILNGNSEAIGQKEAIQYALAQTTAQPHGSSPRFIYTHLLLPHEPFIFDKNGNLLPPQDFYDWHYYQGQYQYTTRVAEQLVTKILAQADPSNPPVIILQSDEGARNLQSRTSSHIVINGVLQNYPTDYYSLILNAMYLPGMDTSSLPPDLAPIQTFALVLNHYLDAGVAVDPACPCDH